MYFNTTMSNSFFIVSITGLILFCIYFSMFLVQKFIDCETETGQISEKECCEGTWRGLTSSVILVLIITGVVTMVSFAIFFFTVRYLYSVPPSTTIQNLSTSIQQAKQNISPPSKLLSDEELKALEQQTLQRNDLREAAAYSAAKITEENINAKNNNIREQVLNEFNAKAEKAAAAKNIKWNENEIYERKIPTEAANAQQQSSSVTPSTASPPIPTYQNPPNFNEAEITEKKDEAMKSLIQLGEQAKQKILQNKSK